LPPAERQRLAHCLGCQHLSWPALCAADNNTVSTFDTTTKTLTGVTEPGHRLQDSEMILCGTATMLDCTKRLTALHNSNT